MLVKVYLTASKFMKTIFPLIGHKTKSQIRLTNKTKMMKLHREMNVAKRGHFSLKTVKFELKFKKSVKFTHICLQ